MFLKSLTSSYFINISILILLVTEAQSARNKGDCILYDQDDKEITSQAWEDGIRLKPVNDFEKYETEIGHFKTKNVGYVSETKHSGKEPLYYQYFKAIVWDDNDDLVLTIGRDFAKYEDYETSQEIDITVEMRCENYEFSTITFHLKIIDTNNHPPKFLHEPYKYTLTMPLPKGYDLDINKQLVARDVDLTNKKMVFTLENNEFTNKFLISSMGQDSNDIKNYLTNFVTATSIDLEDDVTFNVSATDSGTPKTWTTTTTISITVDKGNSFPKFSSEIYTADLTKMALERDERFILQFSEGNITLTRGYKGAVKYEMRGISEDNKKHFKLTHSGAMTNNGITTYVELLDLTKEFLSQNILTVYLTAVKDAVETNTVLQILLTDTSNEGSSAENVTGSNTSTVSATNGFMISTLILSLIYIGL